MYAVIESGGKQYRVHEGDVVRVEKLDQEVGSTLEIDAVHLLSEGEDVHIGTPLLEGARVRTTVVEQGRSSKVIAFKKKRRKGYRRTQGHRQPFTALRVDEILAPGGGGRKGKKKAAAKKSGKKKAPKETKESSEKKATASGSSAKDDGGSKKKSKKSGSKAKSKDE